MLILSRKRHQEIQIGDNIIVKVLKMTGERVELGISAPKEVQVTRPETKKK